MTESDKAIADASFIHWTLCEIRDGHSWGDLIMEVGDLLTEDLEGQSRAKPSFWNGEVGELAATNGYGWPRVLELIAQAMRESPPADAAVGQPPSHTG